MQIMSLPIALASKSPRRQQLLREAGFRFRVVLPNIEEIYPEDLAPTMVPEYLSDLKAQAALPLIQPDEIILAADSIVLLGHQIFEKPKDRADAVRILQTLSGKTHQVITGVTLRTKAKKISFSGYTDVTMEPLSPTEIDYYIDHYNPYDKAGAYGIQEWIGHCKISNINGSYLNVMGLPVDLVYKELENFIV